MSVPALQRGGLTAVAAAVSLGLITSLARLAYDGGSDPLTVVAFRTLIAVGAIGVFLAMSRRDVSLPRHALGLLAGCVLALSVLSLCYLGSVLFIPVSLAALLFYTYPLIIAAMAPLVEGERLGGTRWVAFVIAFCGLALALGPSFGGLDWRGVALAFAAAAGSTGLFFASRRAMRHVEATALSFYSNLGAFPLMVAAMFVIGGPAIPSTALGWGGFTSVGACYAFAVLVLFVAIDRIGSARTAIIMNLEPLVSIAVATVFLGESLTPLQYAGGALVLAAVALSGWANVSRLDPKTEIRHP